MKTRIVAFSLAVLFGMVIAAVAHADEPRYVLKADGTVEDRLKALETATTDLDSRLTAQAKRIKELESQCKNCQTTTAAKPIAVYKTASGCDCTDGQCILRGQGGMCQGCQCPSGATTWTFTDPSMITNSFDAQGSPIFSTAPHFPFGSLGGMPQYGYSLGNSCAGGSCASGSCGSAGSGRCRIFRRR